MSLTNVLVSLEQLLREGDVKFVAYIHFADGSRTITRRLEFNSIKGVTYDSGKATVELGHLEDPDAE